MSSLATAETPLPQYSTSPLPATIVTHWAGKEVLTPVAVIMVTGPGRRASPTLSRPSDGWNLVAGTPTRVLVIRAP